MKSAQGDTSYCVAHGGGRRCQHQGCLKSAIGDTGTCVAHGGGRRCQHQGCFKSAGGAGTDHCVAHGGGRRCQHQGCFKSAGGAGTSHCAAHGGGRRCQHQGCPKPAAPGGTPHCAAHGGGDRCQTEGCSKQARKPRHAALQRARRGQALPGAGLLQGSRSSCRQRVLQTVSRRSGAGRPLQGVPRPSSWPVAVRRVAVVRAASRPSLCGLCRHCSSLDAEQGGRCKLPACTHPL
jgi:hypothetical protein